MAHVPREGMGNATSLFNLMRNLGGSVGISVLTMLNTRYQQKYTNILGSHVTATNPAAQQWFASLRGLFLSTGSGPGLADRRAYGAMFGMVQQQAAMRSFLDLFFLITAVFLCMIPLVAIMKKPATRPGAGAAMHYRLWQKPESTAYSRARLSRFSALPSRDREGAVSTVNAK